MSQPKEGMTLFLVVLIVHYSHSNNSSTYSITHAQLNFFEELPTKQKKWNHVKGLKTCHFIHQSFFYTSQRTVPNGNALQCSSIFLARGTQNLDFDGDNSYSDICNSAMNMAHVVCPCQYTTLPVIQYIIKRLIKSLDKKFWRFFLHQPIFSCQGKCNTNPIWLNIFCCTVFYRVYTLKMMLKYSLHTIHER